METFHSGGVEAQPPQAHVGLTPMKIQQPVSASRIEPCGIKLITHLDLKDRELFPDAFRMIRGVKQLCREYPDDFEAVVQILSRSRETAPRFFPQGRVLKGTSTYWIHASGKKAVVERVNYDRGYSCPSEEEFGTYLGENMLPYRANVVQIGGHSRSFRCIADFTPKRVRRSFEIAHEMTGQKPDLAFFDGCQTSSHESMLEFAENDTVPFVIGYPVVQYLSGADCALMLREALNKSGSLKEKWMAMMDGLPGGEGTNRYNLIDVRKTITLARKLDDLGEAFFPITKGKVDRAKFTACLSITRIINGEKGRETAGLGDLAMLLGGLFLYFYEPESLREGIREAEKALEEVIVRQFPSQDFFLGLPAQYGLCFQASTKTTGFRYNENHSNRDKYRDVRVGHSWKRLIRRCSQDDEFSQTSEYRVVGPIQRGTGL